MSTLNRGFPNNVLTTDRRAFVLLGILTLVWVALYSNLQPIADWLTFSFLGFNQESRIGVALNFFVYDVPKILLLLTGMIFLISALQTFLDMQKIRAVVEERGEGVGNVMASLFGAITPFCSCSSVPLFIGFVQAGIPLGITFSFLITSPLMNEIAFVLLFGLFGWQVAFLYLISGITIGVVAGFVLGRMHLEGYVEDFVYQIETKKAASTNSTFAVKLTWVERFQEAWDNTKEIVDKVWLYVIVGIGIGAVIHGFVPENALTGIMGEQAWWSVPASVVLGIPLYSNAAGIVPVISAMLEKGASLGTALAFMMSVVALSLPEIIILRKVLKPTLIVIFISVVAVSIIITGYLFNLIV